MRITGLIVVLALVIGSCDGLESDRDDVTLLGIIDGDTIRVRIGGEDEVVRLEGVNTPERDECHGDRAATALAGLLAGGEISVVSAGPSARDRFGRLLAYVYAGDVPANLTMIARGHGLALAGDHPRSAEFDSAAESAWADRLGMWSPSACGGVSREDVAIADVVADAPGDDAERPNDEYVVLVNTGAGTVDLRAWTVRDESSVHRYRFPDGASLEPGDRLTLHSGCGDDTGDHFYWCEGPVWSNRGDTVVVQAPDGTVVAALFYR